MPSAAAKARLAVVLSHPIQYYSPLFRLLAGRVTLKVFYLWEGGAKPAYDPGFGRVIQWDIPLLDGYDHCFVPNVSADPGTHHFRGLSNPELNGMLEAWGPDALLVFGWNFRSNLAAMGRFQGRIPVFFRGDSTLIDERPGARRVLRRLFLARVYAKVDTAFYVGTNNRAYFRAHGLKDRQLSFAPHAVETGRFLDPDGACAARGAGWRRELGIPAGARVLLFAGKLEPKKDPVLLLEAFFRLSRPDLHLVFAGNGELEGELRRQAAGEPRVHFLGFQNQSVMPAVYRVGDLYVLPSRGPGETWGLAVNEAFACGRPAVVSDAVGCAPDLVEPGRTGAVFRRGDREGLVGALESVLELRDDPRLPQALADKVARYSLEAAAEAIAAEVGRATGRGGGKKHGEDR